VARPNLRGAFAEDWDEQVADLHYADTPAYATGHGVSAEWVIEDGLCHALRTEWIPAAEVEKTTADKEDIPELELSMEELGSVTDGATIEKLLHPLVDKYRTWIQEQRSRITSLQDARLETAEGLLRSAEIAARRIEEGISILARELGPCVSGSRSMSRHGTFSSWPSYY